MIHSILRIDVINTIFLAYLTDYSIYCYNSDLQSLSFDLIVTNLQKKPLLMKHDWILYKFDQENCSCVEILLHGLGNIKALYV